MPRRKKLEADDGDVTSTVCNGTSSTADLQVFAGQSFVFSSGVDDAADLQKSITTNGGKVTASVTKTVWSLLRKCLS